MKYFIDLIIIFLIAPLLIPILLIVSLLIYLKLGFPILFTQVRPGFEGKPFRMIKFRTMTNVCDANGELLPDSIRLTSFGRLLRSTSIDELPEFWNIIKGEMSLVGPRPLLMQYLPLYSPEQARRHNMRPGITGWAQVNGRNSISWEEKFQLDLWYIDNHNFLLDLKIIWLTLRKVVMRHGVNFEDDSTVSMFTGSKE